MNVAVVGGGAAGFFSAITCAESSPQARVTIFERGERVLAKVKISGGGRCNVTHACFEPKQLIHYYPRGGMALLGPFHDFQPSDTMDWFESRGVKLKTEEDGRVFPVTDQSQTVIDCLVEAARKAKVEVQTGAAIKSIEKTDKGFVLSFADGTSRVFDRLLLATGSNADGYRWVKSLGHQLESPVPSLFTFTITDPRLKGLSGISVPDGRVKLKGKKLEQRGPLLITHWGLSGPAILKLSAWGARILNGLNYQAELEVSWLPEMKSEELAKKFQETKAEHSRKLVLNQPAVDVPQRLWEKLAKAAGVGDDLRWSDITKAHLGRLAEELLSGVYKMTGRSAFKEEFVTCGGVKLNEVDFSTMESKVCPGLYLAGEILDIDALTGGFNFQNAWTTGWIAGKSLAEGV